MDLDRLIKTLHPLEKKVLPYLKDNISFTEIIAYSKLQDVEVMRALQWLENKDVLKIHSKEEQIISLDKNSLKYLETKLPERQLLELLKSKSLTIKEIKEKSDLNEEEINIAIGTLKHKKALTIHDKNLKLTEKGLELLHKELPEENFIKRLHQKILNLDEIKDKEILNSLKKRKEFVKISIVKTKTIKLTELGKRLIDKKTKFEDYIETLTPEILKSKIWKKKSFRYYDIKINVPKIYPGKTHFINEAIDYVKRIWLDLGFKEMNGPILDTAFWNFDALFVPQDHPARDLQDTFYIKRLGNLPNKDLVNKIKQVHETGSNTGSKGWGYKWQEHEAKKMVLRTHTTILSAKTIANLKKSDLPAKFFAVGKCFRNETPDWKHSFEFYQVEGIVIDENVTFKNLLGYLKAYYKKLGFEKIRFKPSFFPYTEPSIQVDYYDNKKGWIELGGAGVFRPEVVKPLLGIDIPILAWGQGMERSIFDYYNIYDYRDLYGNNLKKLKEIKTFLK